MWERFTDNAKRVIAYAREEAVRFSSNYVRTEHVLLAVCRDPDCVGARIMTRMRADLGDVVVHVTEQTTHESDKTSEYEIAFAVPAKRVLERAVEEARRMNHHWLGTEHIVLGIVGEEGTACSQILADYGIDLIGARSEVERFLNER